MAHQPVDTSSSQSRSATTDRAVTERENNITLRRRGVQRDNSLGTLSEQDFEGPATGGNEEESQQAMNNHEIFATACRLADSGFEKDFAMFVQHHQERISLGGNLEMLRCKAITMSYKHTLNSYKELFDKQCPKSEAARDEGKRNLLMSMLDFTREFVDNFRSRVLQQTVGQDGYDENGEDGDDNDDDDAGGGGAKDKSSVSRRLEASIRLFECDTVFILKRIAYQLIKNALKSMLNADRVDACVFQPGIPAGVFIEEAKSVAAKLRSALRGDHLAATLDAEANIMLAFITTKLMHAETRMLQASVVAEMFSSNQLKAFSYFVGQYLRRNQTTLVEEEEEKGEGDERGEEEEAQAEAAGQSQRDRREADDEDERQRDEHEQYKRGAKAGGQQQEQQPIYNDDDQYNTPIQRQYQHQEEHEQQQQHNGHDQRDLEPDEENIAPPLPAADNPFRINKRSKWTDEEEEALVAGIGSHGKSKLVWAKIKSDKRFRKVLKDRSNVNLKDKVRT